MGETVSYLGKGSNPRDTFTDNMRFPK